MEKLPFTLKLPFPPSINHYWRHHVMGGTFKTYISAQGKQFRQDVCKYVRGRGLDIGIDEYVAVSIVLRPPNNARRDVDNYGGKALLDAITKAGVWKDDYLVRKLCMEWGDTVIDGEGETEVTIAKLEN